MPKLYVPMTKVTVTANGHSMDIMLYPTGDRIWDDELMKWQIEHTREQLMQLEPGNQMTVPQRKELGKIVKDILAWQKRVKQSSRPGKTLF